MTPWYTKAALVVGLVVEAVDLAATELAVALVLLLFNEIFLPPRLQAPTGLDNVLRKPISLGCKELLCAAEHSKTETRTLESESESESMIGGSEVYSHRKSRKMG
jgi:hypothetical protein